MVSVANVAPTVSLSGSSPVMKSSVAWTFTFTVSDPGTDGYSVKSGFPDCGTGGSFVAGSLVTNAGGGSFECKFLDGPASPTVRIQVEDADEAAGSTTLNSNIATKAVQVDNVAPTVVLSGADEVDEGDSETYTYTVTDPGVNDTFTVDSGFPDCDFGATNNGVLVGTPVKTAAGGSFVCSFPDGDKSATVKIKVTDNDGGSTTDSENVVVVAIANVAPEVTAAADQS